jgi:hypothetical protein
MSRHERSLSEIFHSGAPRPGPSRFSTSETIRAGRERHAKRVRARLAVAAVAASAIAVIGAIGVGQFVAESVNGGNQATTGGGAPYAGTPPASSPAATPGVPTSSDGPQSMATPPLSMRLERAFARCGKRWIHQAGMTSGTRASTVVTRGESIRICATTSNGVGSSTGPDQPVSTESAGQNYFQLARNFNCDSVWYTGAGHLTEASPRIAFAFPDGVTVVADSNGSGYWAVAYAPKEPFPGGSQVQVTIDGRAVDASLNGDPLSAGC